MVIDTNIMKENKCSRNFIGLIFCEKIVIVTATQSKLFF